MFKRIALISVAILCYNMLQGAVSSGTFTIAESGGNYTTLAAAEADLAATLGSTVTWNITGTCLTPRR